MSIYDKSSLVLIPSGTKTGKVFSQKPVSGDGDFTFTRASAATRVNADGNIEKETQNKLLYSNQPNQWSVVSVSLTSGQAGYDGSNDAWLFDSSAGYISNGLSLSGVYTYSIYAKKGTADGIRLRMDAGTDANVYINLTDGSEFFSNTGIDYSATSVGGGWWRISITANDSSFSNFRVYAIDAGGSTTGTIYIQDAQVNQGLVAQPYQETTTAAVYGGITDNTPRLDYTDSSCPALLLEPQRTNFFPSSEVETSNWLISGGGTTTIEVNAEISPEGVQNAALVTTTAQDGFIYDVLPSVDGTTYTYSFYVKNVDSERTRFWICQGVSNGEINWDGTTISSVTGGINADYEDVGNGWYRVWATATATSSSSFISRFYIDNLKNASSSVYLYGFQQEAGSYPTSYIPTYGSSVSRVADGCSKTGVSDLIGQTEGTMFAEFTIPETQGPSFFSISDGTYANRIIFGYTAGTLRYYVNSSTGGFSVSRTIDSSPVVGQTYKIALAYKNNDFKAYKNGTNTNTETTFTTPSSLTAIDNQGGGVGQFIFAEVNQFMLFKTRLSNEELAALTTI